MLFRLVCEKEETSQPMHRSFGTSACGKQTLVHYLQYELKGDGGMLALSGFLSASLT
jgi:hypothetical protein